MDSFDNGSEPAALSSDLARLSAALEAILFVTDTPVEITSLAEATGLPHTQVKEALDHLRESLSTRGLRLQWLHERVQLVTAPEHAGSIERFLGLELSSKLSTAALETLAIVAYRQPVTRAEIDAIRGVNSSGTLRTLIQRDLIEEAGRLDTAGNPYLYATTPAFLQHFGLTSLDELPELPAEEAVRLLAEGLI